MNLKHSKRYRKTKELIGHGVFTVKSAFDFLVKNNLEKLKKIKLSCLLNTSRKKNKLVNLKSSSFSLPFTNEKKKIVLLTDGFLEEEVSKLSTFSVIYLKKEELKKTFLNEQGKINKSFLKNISFFLVHPSLETEIKFLEKKLSSKGFFPTKKNGFLAEKINLGLLTTNERVKFDKNGNFNFLLGFSSLGTVNLELNFQKVIEMIKTLKPVNWKGGFLKKVSFSTIMGPSITIGGQAFKI